MWKDYSDFLKIELSVDLRAIQHRVLNHGLWNHIVLGSSYLIVAEGFAEHFRFLLLGYKWPHTIHYLTVQEARYKKKGSAVLCFF